MFYYVLNTEGNYVKFFVSRFVTKGDAENEDLWLPCSIIKNIC